MKTCIKCHKLKELTNYYPNRNDCKECSRAAERLKYKKNSLHRSKQTYIDKEHAQLQYYCDKAIKAGITGSVRDDISSKNLILTNIEYITQAKLYILEVSKKSKGLRNLPSYIKRVEPIWLFNNKLIKSTVTL